MMQAAQSRDRNDSAIGRRILFDLASTRGFFAKAEVGAVLVIVGDVCVHESLQLALVHHKHMVEQVPTAIADEALRDSVLPWALKACSLGLNTEALDRINHMVIEVRATIKYEIARRRVVRKRLPQLLDQPRARRMPGHVEVKNTPAVMRDHEEAVKHAECHCRHGEEIHRGDRFTVLLRNAAQRLAGSGFLGAFRIQRRTVRSEISYPSIFSSPWIRGAPQVLFSMTMRKMSSRSAFGVGFLPDRARAREIHFQYVLNPARCQRTTVSGCTMRRTRLHSGQNRRRMIQNTLSWATRRGRRCLAAKITSC